MCGQFEDFPQWSSWSVDEKDLYHRGGVRDGRSRSVLSRSRARRSCPCHAHVSLCRHLPRSTRWVPFPLRGPRARSINVDSSRIARELYFVSNGLPRWGATSELLFLWVPVNTAPAIKWGLASARNFEPRRRITLSVFVRLFAFPMVA